MIRRLVPFIFLAFLIGNRFFSKLISVGPIYISEVFIVLSVVYRIKLFLSAFKTNKFFVLFFLYFIFFAFFDYLSSEWTLFSLRRVAVFGYFIFPLIIFIYLNEISRMINKYFLFIVLIAVLLAVLSPAGYQSSMASQFLGVLFLVSVIKKMKLKSMVFSGGAFLLVVSGILIGESVFRTPIVTIFSIVFIYLLLNRTATLAGFYQKNSIYMLLGLGFILFLYLGLVGDILIGLSGLLNSEGLKDLGVYLGGELFTTRGTSSGTTGTRLLFWQLIIENNFSKVFVFLFGNGFEYGFLEVVAPEFLFRDKELIEPHNSFIGIFFKSGIVGLLLCFIFIVLVFRSQAKVIGFTKAFPFLLGALMFASFEVALENPHGAALFWFILLSPSIFSIGYSENFNNS